MLEKRKNKAFNDAKDIIVKNNLIFIEDIIANIGISKPTFYKYFKVGGEEFNELKRLLDRNRIDQKVSMRKKWFDSDAPALQMGLYKLLSTEEELIRLSNQYKIKEEDEDELNETDEAIKAIVGLINKKSDKK